jgi:hypothetical protein
MSDIISNASQSVSIQERVRLAVEAKAKLDEQIAENNRLLEDLRKAEDAILNDPVERAKLFVDANKMIEAGIKEYDAKGYSCDVQFDDYGLLTKIVFKSGKSRKSGTRGPRKVAGQDGFIPAMTRDQFVEIYSTLGNEFKNNNIVEALVNKFGGGKYTDYRPQPSLGLILADGYEGIKIEKVGTKGRNVYYKKIS